MPKARAKELHPDAHFASIFELVGIKNAESADERDHVYKGRIVLGGHTSGDWAIFGDGGTVPSTMTAARVALAVAAMQELEVKQSDCLRERRWPQTKFAECCKRKHRKSTPK